MQEACQFKQKLQEIYRSKDKIPSLIEALEEGIPQRSLDDFYIPLKLIFDEDNEIGSAYNEAVPGRKQEIKVEAIFDQLPTEDLPVRNDKAGRLLILGGAGVGKTTLLQYIAFKWSKEEFLNDKFDYVCRISLRTLNSRWSDHYDYQEKEKDLLKCLAHYNLVAGLTTQERGKVRLEYMAWFDKKDRVLLLIDGYDEVAQTDSENPEYLERVLGDIFEHKNIILTSRPNAVDKQMAQKFGRKIENIGFDNDGVNQYLEWYFKDDKTKGSNLAEFLKEKSFIKEICHTPLHIAMTCFIWSQGASNIALSEVSNTSDLYSQVVEILGFRYYAKQPQNLGKSKESLQNKWRGEKINIAELQVLRYLAYKALTGGRLEISDHQRFEATIIPGMTKKGDQYDVSIQSCINYLGEKLKELPTIHQVYKFGLLKSEGVLQKDAPDQEPSETDLQFHSFSFTHFSFQEFLAAQYLDEKLMDENNKKEQENIANFIALYRNEPRSLNTLKFMAGLLSSAEGAQAEHGIQIFWEAIMCNPDGVLEFGVETKVTLLMHLFSQVTKEEKIDRRIPHNELAVDLIDCIVLGSFSRWRTPLKESEYISHNIKEGCRKFLVEDNVSWLSNKSLELQRKINPQLKIKKVDASHDPLEEVISIVCIIMNKFSEKEQDQVFAKIYQLLQGEEQKNWRSRHKAIELILIIIRGETKIKIKPDGLKGILDCLLLTAYDRNLHQVSCEAIREIIRRNQTSKLVKKIKQNIQQELENVKIEKRYLKM